MKVVNKKEIAVFGIRKSGNHAISVWLLRHLGRRAVHLGDVTGESPYDSCAEINTKRLCQWRCKPAIRNIHKIFSRKGVTAFPRNEQAVNWKYIRHFSPKDCLILSYKNRFLDDAVYEAYVQRHDIHVGSSEQRHRVVILRDAFNLFASLLRTPGITAHDIATCIRIYKQYAELFLDASRQKQQNIICISYNKWFSSRDYRAGLVERFGVTLDREPVRAAPSNGNGSSLDHDRQGGNDQRKRVLERWQTCRNDPAYRAIFKDAHLAELSESVFGRIVPEAW